MKLYFLAWKQYPCSDDGFIIADGGASLNDVSFFGTPAEVEALIPNQFWTMPSNFWVAEVDV